VKLSATPAAVSVVERALAERSGELTITLGTGCCESTAPFLYDNYYVGYDHEAVGEVAGVKVYAPEFLRTLYDGDHELVVDVSTEAPDDSMSIETDWGCRLILRGGEQVADRA
jgi:uncharacterized protein